MIELLSPAGNFEKLKIALEYGADALYGGVSHFSLRSRSGKEFTYESFQEAIEYVHSKDKKIYATVNGFPFNSQIELLKNHIKKLASFKPDAFIVSTVGVIQLAKEIAPEIELHLSTQANVLNYLDATAYYDMGVKRIIVAREIGLNDLKVIKERVPELELEIFVHGSMCFAYSGRCLISSVQSGRVPNRGSCANDCRFDYKLFAKNKKTDELLEIEENEIYVKSPEHNSLFRIEEYRDGSYIMNAKDLNLSGYIDEILESGVVDSIKIEGRTKSPYYTAITTKTYREAVDDFSNGSFDKLKYQRELDTLKNRGYSDSYIVSKPSERTDTQNLEFALSDGSYQVEAIISEDGEKFFARGQVYRDVEYEIVSHSKINPIDNDIAKIYEKNGNFYIMFKSLETESGKILDSVHSGNINAIVLPSKLPKYSFFRRKIKE